MSRVLTWAAITGAVVASLVAAVVPGADAPRRPGERADAIAAELRCPVCEGLSVADSSSPTARNLRTDIARRIREGQTDEEIRDAYVSRYGEWILLTPRRSGLGALAWGAPIGLAAAGVIGLVVAFRRWRGSGDVAPVTEEMASEVSAAMAEWARERQASL